MTLYRLLKENDWALFVPKCTLVLSCIFFAASGVFFLTMKNIEEDAFGICMGFLCLFVALLMLFAHFAGQPIFNRYATLEDGVLTVCTRKGRKIRCYPLHEMDITYALVFYRGNNLMDYDYQKSFVLYPKGMILGKQTYGKNGECMQKLNAWARDRNKMVFIINKELEEKILAYYAEQPIDDQE